MFTANYKNKLNETIENAIFVLGFYINYVVCEYVYIKWSLCVPIKFYINYVVCELW